MPAKGVIHHVDLAGSDVERSLAFYLDLLGPAGMEGDKRYPTYRGTEEVVYLGTGEAYADVGNAGPDAGHTWRTDGGAAARRASRSSGRALGRVRSVSGQTIWARLVAA